VARKEDAWFETYRIRGKVTTVPIRAVGWISIVAIVAVPVMLSLLVVPALVELHFGLLAAWVVLSLALTFMALIVLIRAKSRER
jgi:hypothetical protein